jgi:hypothetical protein
LIRGKTKKQPLKGSSSDGGNAVMPMPMIDPDIALRTISQSPWTILVIAANGSIKECVPCETMPSLDWDVQNRDRIRGCAVRTIPRGVLSPHELKKITEEAAKYLQMFKRHEDEST